MPQSMNSMREAAIRRAREMYARATPNTATQIPNGNLREKESPQTQSEKEEKQEGLNEDFLQTFFKDKERMLIIALLVILSQEEGNNSLLFALMYLLL